MREFFEKQLEKRNIVTEEMHKNIKSSHYDNGDKIDIGDTVLYALLFKNKESDGTILLTLILLNEMHFDLYLPFNDYKINNNSILPILKRK